MDIFLNVNFSSEILEKLSLRKKQKKIQKVYMYMFVNFFLFSINLTFPKIFTLQKVYLFNFKALI